MPHLKASSSIDWHYEVDGEGEVLLFIHGWGVDKRIWRQQSKFFSDYYRVIGIDLPGHGMSGWQKVPFKQMALDVKEILDYLNVRELSIVGSSFGGLLAFQFYELFPSMIKRMVFVGSMPKFSKSPDFPYGLDVAQMRKLNSQLDVAYPSVVNIFFRSLFTIEERESRRFKWLQKFRQNDEVPIKQALVEYLDILESEDLRHVLPAVKIPMLFINGREDTICCSKTVDYLQKVSPHSSFFFFEKCGHFPFLSKPHEFNDVLKSFLEKTKPS